MDEIVAVVPFNDHFLIFTKYGKVIDLDWNRDGQWRIRVQAINLQDLLAHP